MNSSQTSQIFQDSSSILIDALNYRVWMLGLIVSFYIILLATSGYVVRRTLSYADLQIENDSTEKDTGTAIGKVENVLILSLMLLEAYTALGVIFAAKSIVRREDIGTGDTTYYLTGTIANFTYSIVFGLLLQIILWLLIQ